VSQGPRGDCLMKKTEGRKSRDTVPLSVGPIGKGQQYKIFTLPQLNILLQIRRIAN
jgi:hypothetical protein